MPFNIDDEYALTAWISLKLDPITSKDPKQTAKYVVAFVKKSKDDKDIEGLRLMYRKRMLDFINDKERLYDFCDELIDALKSSRYLEVREHPSYNTLLEETGPLTPSNKEFSNVRDDDRQRDIRDRSRSPKTSRRNRSRSLDDDEMDEAIEDKPPVRVKTSPEERKPTVNSTISVVDDALAKRLGKRPVHGRLSCKDFNEKGYCMRGQFCPYDHGSDPVVWQNAPRPQMEVPVMRYPGPPRMPVMSAPPRMPMPGFPPLLPPGIMRPVMGRRIRPDGPSMPPFMRPPKPNTPNMQRPRENIVGIPQDEMLFRTTDYGKRENENRRNEIASKRLAVGDVSTNGSSLEIQNIPPQLNNITALNAHFNKYGPMTNVQVSYNNNPGTALVTFSTADAAMRAFSSPEPVLNNRFIRISWHNENKTPTPIQLKRTVTFSPANTDTGILTPVGKKTQSILSTDAAVGKMEGNTDPVAPGFTSGFHLRLSPIGAPSGRGRASRYMRGPAMRHERLSHPSPPDQQQVLSAHHKLIFLSLQVSKAEGEVEKAQIQVNSCDEVIAKLNASIQSYQQTSDKTKARLETDPNGPKAAEISELMEKFVNQIQQWQGEVHKREEERSDLLKSKEEAEAMLSAARKRLCDAQKIFAQADALVEEVDQKFSEASLRSRANGRIVRTPRGAVRGGRVSRRATGTTRARRPARGQPFNRSVDRRPKRLRISALDKDEKQTLTNQVEENGGVVESFSDLDDTSAWMIAKFNTRFDAELFLRNLSQGEKKTITSWVTDEEARQSAGEQDVEANGNGDLESEAQEGDSSAAEADHSTDLMDTSAVQDKNSPAPGTDGEYDNGLAAVVK